MLECPTTQAFWDKQLRAGEFLNETLVGDIQLFFTFFFKKVSQGGREPKKKGNNNNENNNNNDNNNNNNNNDNNTTKKSNKKPKWSFQQQKEEMENLVKINATADRSKNHSENLQSEIHSNK